MVEYMAFFPNEYEKSFNYDIINSTQDLPIEDFIIMAMKEFEAVENIEILDIKIVNEQHKVNLNNHIVNVNYKKKDIYDFEVPKYNFVNPSRYGEIIFTIKVSTNLNEKIIEKPILYPLEYEGFYYNNGKKMKAIWQLVDASTYAQRGKTTLKGRMPIIIYQNKNRMITDVEGTEHICHSYSYALNGKSKIGLVKAKPKFIPPLMVMCAKMGLDDTVDFFGMKDIVFIDKDWNEEDLKTFYVFELDNIYLKVFRNLFDKYELVSSFVTMLYNIRSKDFPLDFDNINDTEYWICRVGTLGSAKNKNIFSFKAKGLTTMYMIERLLDEITKMNLRIPEYYKQNIYYLMYWMITNFDNIRSHSNIDMANKRIRKNEHIVFSSLGKKINENLNKLIEKKGKSKMNTMDTLLELFNFPSDIIMSGMRNSNDLIKTDDIVNDLNFLLDLSYSAKGYQAIGADGVKKISNKYRYLHPSMAGKLDLNTSSNSDVGLSGSLVPTVKLYDRYYFTDEKPYYANRYNFDKELKRTRKASAESYIDDLYKNDKFKDKLKYIPIEIVEKE